MGNHELIIEPSTTQHEKMVGLGLSDPMADYGTPNRVFTPNLHGSQLGTVDGYSIRNYPSRYCNHIQNTRETYTGIHIQDTQILKVTNIDKQANEQL